MTEVSERHSVQLLKSKKGIILYLNDHVLIKGINHHFNYTL